MFNICRLNIHATGDKHVTETIGDVSLAVFVHVIDLTERKDASSNMGLGELLGLPR